MARSIELKYNLNQLVAYSPLTIKLSFGARFFASFTKGPYEPIFPTTLSRLRPEIADGADN